MNEEYYILRIDTDTYAGDFYLQMCCFVTGIEIDSPDDSLDVYQDEVIARNFRGYLKIKREVTEQGGKWRAPCAYSGENGRTVDIFFQKPPTEEQINLIKDRVYRFPAFYLENDAYSELMGGHEIEIERIIVNKITIKETPFKVLLEPKTALENHE